MKTESPIEEDSSMKLWNFESEVAWMINKEEFCKKLKSLKRRMKDAISCYVCYGEYSPEKIWSEIEQNRRSDV